MNGPDAQRLEIADASLGALLAVQIVTQFGVVPLTAIYAQLQPLLNLAHLTFAAICIAALARHRALRAILLAGLAIVAVVLFIWNPVLRTISLNDITSGEVISAAAVIFNVLITVLIMRHVFGRGKVTAYRLQGAVLIYLNMAALFAIIYGVLVANAPGAITSTDGAALGVRPGQQLATLSYFSLATITTTGYGDLVPLHPLARALANLEATFGQLFPATVVARLVGLHLFHTGDAENGR